NQLVAKTSPSASCFLPNKQSVRHLMKDSGVPYSIAGEQIVLVGAAAEEVSKRCAVKTEHLLARNPLRKDQQTIAEPLNELIASLVPSASVPGDVCSLGLLADELHADWLRAVVVSRGYQVVDCSAGLAVILAELVRENFTGIGIVFGASRCEAVLAREGVEIARYELPRGGEAIDQSIAISEDRYWWSMSGFRELETESITQWKEALGTSVLEPSNPRSERLLNGYHQLVIELCTACETHFPQSELPDQLAVVACGGATRIPGFADLLNQHLSDSSLPIAQEKTRIESGEYTVSRGLLIHAELQQRSHAQSKAA
ncbi:MAG: hypothetical protein KDA84_07490, partial [Planctomycetaceae bacterium]|nr:hypothetical protein [Planctomycetaceae bacterium]